MNDSIHERKIVRKPSFRDKESVFLTNMKGKAPTSSVMMKLISKGANAES
jgi:hypothetical protein